MTTSTLVVIAISAFLLGMLLGIFLCSLLAVSEREERHARKIEHSLTPFDDSTITRPGAA
jgi:hypothetical protein